MFPLKTIIIFVSFGKWANVYGSCRGRAQIFLIMYHIEYSNQSLSYSFILFLLPNFCASLSLFIFLFNINIHSILRFESSVTERHNDITIILKKIYLQIHNLET